VTNVAAYVTLIIFSLLWLAPLAWAIDTAIKPEVDTTRIPVSWIPTHMTFAAFGNILSGSSLPRWFVNSAITSTLITVITVLVTSMTAYALSRVPFRGRRVVFWLIMAGIIVPVEALIVPLFSEINAMHLIDTYWGIVLPQLAAPVAVYIFKQFFDGIPADLEEAALIDGANRWRVYWNIWMPLARPAIAAVAIFTFVTSWNSFTWPLIATTSTAMMTIPVGIATVQSAFGIHYAQIMASAVLAGLPLLVIFLIFQRAIVQGISGTGIKG
jgi:multiple sugar transport system permease protein